MKGMQGVDISHWNQVYDWGKVRDKKDFVIIKATGGEYFLDWKFRENQHEARRHNFSIGYYHFARGGNAKREAEHFVKSVGEIKTGEILVLDWEIQHSEPVRWCLRFLKEVEKMVGFKPLIYLNKATLKRYDWKPVVKNDNGLWIASFGINIGTMGKVPPASDWRFWAIWQYTSRGRVKGVKGWVDLNFSRMDKKIWDRYGKPKFCDDIKKTIEKLEKELKKEKDNLNNCEEK